MKQRKPKKISVCIINHFGYPLYNPKFQQPFGGGAAVQLYNLANEFSKDQSLTVSVITGNYGENVNRKEVIKNINIFRVLPIKSKFSNYFKGFFIFFYNLIRINPDILIQRTANVSSGLSAIYCRLFKKIFIYSLASMYDVNQESFKGFFGKFYKYGLMNASFIIAQNTNQIKKLKNLINKNNAKIIKNGFEITNIKLSEKKEILWIGRADYYKKPEIFLKLAAKFPNEKFIMICNKGSNPQYWKQINNIANKMSNIEFIEYIKFHNIECFYKRAKVVINTSIYEGFPNTFIEAFKYRALNISLNVDPDKIFRHKEIGLYCNDDFKKMESYLNLALNNKYVLNVERAWDYVNKNHDIKKIANEWIQLFKLILKI